ncbi:hypothetical protein FW774_04455 (plasmid) [Pedobacter sp. BS3]|nr:hypothetical protein FW774_04455 [Pedobacter sp. BS3]
MSLAESAGAPQYEGIANILMALNLMQRTDLWEDLPYSEAFWGSANLTPKYDNQGRYLQYLPGSLWIIQRHNHYDGSTSS